MNLDSKIQKRKINDRLRDDIDKLEYTIVAGARQVGKTTVLKQLHAELAKRKVPVFRLNFKDTALIDSLNRDPENIFHHIPDPEERKVYLLIDDIHYLAHPDDFMIHLFKQFNDKLKIVATSGTNFYDPLMLNPQFRKIVEIAPLYPLDFEEFLQFKGYTNLVKEWIEIQQDKEHRTYKRKKLELHFNEYLTYGGYPDVVLAETNEQKEEILQDLATTHIKQDIYEAHIQNSEKLYKLLSILAYKTGDLVNMSELSTSLQLSITAIENYIQILADNYHISLVKPFYSQIKKELKKMPKIYFNDLGLRNVLLKQFLPIIERLDRHQLIENYIYIRLRMMYEERQINYWRTADGNEVDFVMINHKLEGRAVETKFNSREFKLSKYKKFAKSYPDVAIQCRAYQSDSNDENVLGL